MSPFDPTHPASFARRAGLYALAFEEAGHALAQQERALADVRARGAALVATAAVTASVFGGPLVGRTHTAPALYVAVCAFVGVCLCAIAMLWPLRFGGVLDTARLISTYAEPTHVELPLVHRDLAVRRSERVGRNRVVLSRLTRVSRAALALLAVEVVAWVVNYAQGV